uniref:AB hydrolase-1 domain-containing protein n=1 Tax=Brassica oleracea TaxID=3712 RepID=A0A3P6FBG9_BRAOL|nr:unnamed protein product [Brassica oleracea]
MSGLDGVEHKTLKVNGINMHVAEIPASGSGRDQIILFIHGFPELWYTWRHQMTALSSLGYRTIAPDLRGYGDTDAPEKVEEYTYLNVVGDLVALIDAVAGGDEAVFLVGHDWGALIAWQLCMYRPEKVKALVNMSVAFSPRNQDRVPMPTFRRVFGDDYYICRFQVISYFDDKKVGHFFQIAIFKFFSPKKLMNFNIVSNYIYKCIFIFMKLFWSFFSLTVFLRNRSRVQRVGNREGVERVLHVQNGWPALPPQRQTFKRPENAASATKQWLTQEDLEYYVSKYEKKGFTGAINYYRNIDRNWELTAPSTGAKIGVPVKFIVGDQDLTYNSPGIKEYIHGGGFKRDVPLLDETVVLNGVGHFLHEENPDVINQHIHSFFQKFI